MSAKSRFRTLLFYAGFAIASMLGTPIRAEEIERLMRNAVESKIVYTIGDGEEPTSHGDTEGTEPE